MLLDLLPTSDISGFETLHVRGYIIVEYFTPISVIFADDE
jgi:hypothetical protein